MKRIMNVWNLCILVPLLGLIFLLFNQCMSAGESPNSANVTSNTHGDTTWVTMTIPSETVTSNESTAGSSDDVTATVTMSTMPTVSNAPSQVPIDSPFFDDDYYPGFEEFALYNINNFIHTTQDNLSTFSIDVDTGSYTWGRNAILNGRLPDPTSVRIEEYINYFRQDYTYPESDPFKAITDGSPSPFRDDLYLLRIGIQGKDLQASERKPWNLTFLVDVSGSMSSRIQLVKDSLIVLVNALSEADTVSICTYAGGVRTVLEPTGIDEKAKIEKAITDLYTGGGTAMADGIENAYTLNLKSFIQGGVNRVIVCSDGDANIGSRSFEEILDSIKGKVKEGITLSTVGFGTGNYNDVLMEQLADNGNGNYFYIDTIKEAERIFVEDLTGTIQVIAKDVKIQMEFNPNTVVRYRLLGYENREIADTDFDNDQVDAGEIGAKHRVTALYEVELVSEATEKIGALHIRYKEPDGVTSSELIFDVTLDQIFPSFTDASLKFRFTACVGEFAEILRHSPFVAGSTLGEVYEYMLAAASEPEDDRETEVIQLVKTASTLN